MFTARKIVLPGCALAVGAAALVASVSLAQTGRDSQPAAPSEFQLPEGWTMEDMEACMMAGTPGPMHERLMKGVGVWYGKGTMWMGPGGASVEFDCTSTVTSIMDGRYTTVEFKGDLPGMGPYHGSGLNGYDNVAEQFVSTWIDSHSTAIMYGTGKMEKDAKAIHTSFGYHCPITKKPTTMRHIERFSGDNTMTMEIYNIDPKSGKEYKSMAVTFTRK